MRVCMRVRVSSFVESAARMFVHLLTMHPTRASVAVPQKSELMRSKDSAVTFHRYKWQSPCSLPLLSSTHAATVCIYYDIG